MPIDPTQSDLLKRIRADVRGMQAYHVQAAKGMVKLDAMENPYALPPELQVKLGQRLGALALNRYPGDRVDDLKQALAKHAQLPDGYGLMLGNGSDELISLLSLACAVPGASVLAPVPGFVMYEVSARLQGLGFHGVDLTADFQLDATAMINAIQTHMPSMVYLAYPNNPTANLWDDAVIERIIQVQSQQNGWVVMDEAYQPFASRSYIDRITRHSNVLLMRTLSKFGLAGVRLGYLIGPKAIIEQVDKVRPPYNVSVLNCECALFALEHQAVFAQQAEHIRRERDDLLLRLNERPDVVVFPSEANMILIRVPRAQQIFDGLKARGVLVKNVSKMHPMLTDCLRLTVGTPEENTQMLNALIALL